MNDNQGIAELIEQSKINQTANIQRLLHDERLKRVIKRVVKSK